MVGNVFLKSFFPHCFAEWASDRKFEFPLSVWQGEPGQWHVPHLPDGQWPVCANSDGGQPGPHQKAQHWRGADRGHFTKWVMFQETFVCLYSEWGWFSNILQQSHLLVYKGFVKMLNLVLWMILQYFLTCTVLKCQSLTRIISINCKIVQSDSSL